MLKAFQDAQKAVRAGSAAGVKRARDAVQSQLVALFSQVRFFNAVWRLYVYAAGVWRSAVARARAQPVFTYTLS